MDAVVSEMLRLWPPAANTDRMCVKVYDYDDGTCRFRIEPGSALWIPISALYWDDQSFPDPRLFDPDRFADENKRQFAANAYLRNGTAKLYRLEECCC